MMRWLVAVLSWLGCLGTVWLSEKSHSLITVLVVALNFGVAFVQGASWNQSRSAKPSTERADR